MRDKIEKDHEFYNRKRKHRQNNLLAFWGDRLSSAKKRMCIFDIDKFYLSKLYTGFCAITGVELTTKYNLPNTASIDRINSDGGYTRSNIQIICQAINHGKNKFANEEVVSYIKATRNLDHKFNRLYTPKAFKSYQQNLMGYLKYSLTRSRNNAKKMKRECIVTIDDLTLIYERQNRMCGLTGIRLREVPGFIDSLSIDRIDSKIGYISTNIQLTTIFANLAKRNKSNQEMCLFFDRLKQ